MILEPSLAHPRPGRWSAAPRCFALLWYGCVGSSCGSFVEVATVSNRPPLQSFYLLLLFSFWPHPRLGTSRSRTPVVGPLPPVTVQLPFHASLSFHLLFGFGFSVREPSLLPPGACLSPVSVLSACASAPFLGMGWWTAVASTVSQVVSRASKYIVNHTTQLLQCCCSATAEPCDEMMV